MGLPGKRDSPTGHYDLAHKAPQINAELNDAQSFATLKIVFRIKITSRARVSFPIDEVRGHWAARTV